MWTFNDVNQAFTFLDLGATPGLYTDIMTLSAGLSGSGSNPANWTITNPGFVGTFILDGNTIDLNLTAVPEPSTCIGGALAVTLLVGTRLRKRFSRASLSRRK